MTQRKAVVDVFELSDTDTAQFAAKRAGWTHHAQGMMIKEGSNAGKLTKEDIDAMTIAFESARSDIWKSPVECMVAAAKAAGLEVEE